jgi:O-acetyl-ADP-ribose deacetylase (regulator of RNase III)
MDSMTSKSPRPSLQLTNGDLLTAPEQIIAHGCNLQGVMGAGVALALKKKWPHVEKAYLYGIASGAATLGSVVWATLPDRRQVANVMTQKNYGRSGRLVSYDAVDRGLREVAQRALEQDVTAIAIPAIGMGLGGGKPTVIREIISEIGIDHQVSFTIYVKDALEYTHYLEELFPAGQDSPNPS